VNIGLRPTFGGTTPTVEAHLLGADEDLYGKVLTLALVERLRAEAAFEGPEALVKQVRADIEAAGRLLGETIDDHK
jgi:riboflavin kinase/FMN adenylyltransferase